VQSPPGGAPPPSALPELSDAEKKRKTAAAEHNGGSNANDSVRIALAVNAIALTQAIDRAARAEEAATIGQPQIEEFGKLASGTAEEETLRRITPNASALPAASCGAAAAPAASPTLAPPAAIAAPAAASSSSQTDVDMVASGVAQARVAAANSAEPVHAVHPPEAVVQTIPPRSIAPSANAPASSSPAAGAPFPVAVSQGGVAGDISACSPECFEAKQAVAAFEQKVAKLQQQLREKNGHIKLLKSMVHSSSAAAAGAGGSASSSSSSTDASAAVNSAQQRIAELEAQLFPTQQLLEDLMRDWTIRAGYFLPGDPAAEAKKAQLTLKMRKNASCSDKALAAAQKLVMQKRMALACEEDALKHAAKRAAHLRTEYAFAQMDLERKQALAANQTELQADHVAEQTRLLLEAEERRERNDAAKAHTRRLRNNDAQLQHRLDVDQYEGIRAMFGARANNLLMPGSSSSSSSSSSSCSSSASAGAGIGQPTASSASGHQRHECVDDEADEDNEAEEESGADSEDNDAEDNAQME
jgi:hypothetical protein